MTNHQIDAIKWDSLDWNPLGERILIKRRQLQDKAKSIIVPEKLLDHNTKLTEGILIKVGEGVNHPSLSPGIPVRWGKHAGFEFSKGEDVYLIMNVGDLVEFGVKEGGDNE